MAKSAGQATHYAGVERSPSRLDICLFEWSALLSVFSLSIKYFLTVFLSLSRLVKKMRWNGKVKSRFSSRKALIACSKLPNTIPGIKKTERNVSHPYWIRFPCSIKVRIIHEIAALNEFNLLFLAAKRYPESLRIALCFTFPFTHNWNFFWYITRVEGRTEITTEVIEGN